MIRRCILGILIVVSTTLFDASSLEANEPKPDLSELTDLFVRIYHDLYGVDMTSPAIYETGESWLGHKWTSTAYVGQKLYRIYLDDDGSYRSLVSDRQNFGEFHFAPKGTLKVFVIVTDDGCTNIADLFDTLWAEMLQTINDIHVQHALSIGWPDPILQFENTSWLVDSADFPIDYSEQDPYWAWQVRNWMVAQGYDPLQYDLVALARFEEPVPGIGGGGTYLHPDFPFMYLDNQFYSPGEVVDLSVIEPETGLPRLYRTADYLSNHEGSHLFLWEHDWSREYYYEHPQPALRVAPELFGWTDCDNDGVPEILDSTPYGIELQGGESAGAVAVSEPSILARTEGPALAASTSPPFNGWVVLGGVDASMLSAASSELDLENSLTIETRVNFEPFAEAQIMRKGGAYSLYTETRTWSGQNLRCLNLQLWSYHSSFRRQQCTSEQEGGLWSQGWHHVAGVYDRTIGEMSLFLDGERLGDAWDIPTVSPDLTGDPLQVGIALAGTMDELALSEVARYSGDSYAVPAQPLGCDEGARALWHFDECEGATRFHDTCGALDNVLVGEGGAHTEGVICQKVHLPLVAR